MQLEKMSMHEQWSRNSQKRFFTHNSNHFDKCFNFLDSNINDLSSVNAHSICYFLRKNVESQLNKIYTFTSSDGGQYMRKHDFFTTAVRVLDPIVIVNVFIIHDI